MNNKYTVNLDNAELNREFFIRVAQVSNHDYDIIELYSMLVEYHRYGKVDFIELYDIYNFDEDCSLVFNSIIYVYDSLINQLDCLLGGHRTYSIHECHLLGQGDLVNILVEMVSPY